MDIRMQKTQEAIFDAFFDLLGEQSFHQISVGQIIARARIGRSTFYSHFASKDELLVAVTRQLFEHVFETSSYAEHMQGDGQGQEESLLDLLSHLFQHFKDNESRVTTLFKLEDDYFARSLDQQLQQYLVPPIKARYFQDSRLPVSLIEHHISATFTSCLSWWLAQKDDLTARALSFYFLQLLA